MANRYTVTFGEQSLKVEADTMYGAAQAAEERLGCRGQKVEVRRDGDPFSGEVDLALMLRPEVSNG